MIASTDRWSGYVKLAESDVLLGRGSGVARHPGNTRFRCVVIKHKGKYATATRTEKMGIAVTVVEELEHCDPPARFVEADGSRYFLVDRKRAVEKTAQALRERKWTMKSMNPIKENLVHKSPQDVTKKIVPDRSESFMKQSASLRIKISAKTTKESQGKITKDRSKGVLHLKRSAKLQKTRAIPKKGHATPKKGNAKPKKSNATPKKANATHPAIPKVTPPSTPTMEESGNDMFAGFGTWLPLKRRLQLNDDSSKGDPSHRQVLATPRPSYALAQGQEAKTGDFLHNNDDDKEDGILSLPKDDFFVPLEMVNLTRIMSTSYETIIPDDESLDDLPDDELFPFDFAFDDGNDSEYTTSNVAFHYRLSNGFI